MTAQDITDAVRAGRANAQDETSYLGNLDILAGDLESSYASWQLVQIGRLALRYRLFELSENVVVSRADDGFLHDGEEGEMGATAVTEEVDLFGVESMFGSVSGGPFENGSQINDHVHPLAFAV